MDLPDLLQAFVTFLLVVLGFLGTTHENWIKDHRRAVILLVVSLGLTGFFLTYLGSKQTAEQRRQQVETNSRLTTALTSLQGAATENARVSSLNTDLQKRLLEQSGQIVSLSQQSLATTTGGDAYAFVGPAFMSTEQITLAVSNAGKFPLYDLSVRVVDLRKMKSDGVAAMPLESVNIGNLPPSTSSMMAPIRLLAGDRQYFNVFFIARNGHWDQEFRMRKVEGAWKTGTRVFWRLAQGIPRKIYEYVDPGFPRDPKGQVDWSEP